jgi:hypothetical protein
MTSVAPPICGGCKHLNRTNPRPLLDPKCDAFPQGIPWDVLLSKVDHRQPLTGDHGVEFEPVEPSDADYADFIFRTGPHQKAPEA